MSSSAIFHCLLPAMRIYALPTHEWRAAVDAIPDTCQHADKCAHGSCRQVARQWLTDMHQRVRAARGARDAA